MIPLDVRGLTFNDPVWLVWVKTVLVLVVVLLWTIMNVWFERKTLAKMQNRIGPSFNGPWGLFQTIAEGVKLLIKEDFSPKNVDKWVYNLAPILTGVAAFSVWAVIPMGGQVNMFGVQTRLQLADGPIAVLFVLAIASVGVYGLVLAGWASSDSYSLLGGLRASAQTISYEVAMGLSIIPVFMWSGTMSTAGIVEAQHQAIAVAPFGHTLYNGPGHYWIMIIPSFIVFLFAMFGEANRTPFDLVEAEQELVSGHITEYTGFRYALYYLGEYIHMATAGALVTTMFLGGYHAPWPLHNTWFDTGLGGYIGIFWFLFKSQLVIFFMVWVRASVPRLRYDQFMSLGWKFLIPISLGWVVLAGLLRSIQNEQWLAKIPPVWFYGTLGGLVVLALIIGFLPEKKPAVDEFSGQPFDAFAGGYPVPPLPGEVGVDPAHRVVAHQMAEAHVEADAVPVTKKEG